MYTTGSAEAVIGRVHTFQVLFVDSSNIPISVNTPLIEVFQYDQTGAKTILVPSTAMTPDGVETGRYSYMYSVGLTFSDGDTIYGTMTGVDPGSGDTLRAEQTVDLVSANRASASSCAGLRAKFVR